MSVIIDNIWKISIDVDISHTEGLIRAYCNCFVAYILNDQLYLINRDKTIFDLGKYTDVTSLTFIEENLAITCKHQVVLIIGSAEIIFGTLINNSYAMKYTVKKKNVYPITGVTKIVGCYLNNQLYYYKDKLYTCHLAKNNDELVEIPHNIKAVWLSGSSVHYLNSEDVFCYISNKKHYNDIKIESETITDHIVLKFSGYNVVICPDKKVIVLGFIPSKIDSIISDNDLVYFVSERIWACNKDFIGFNMLTKIEGSTFNIKSARNI